MRSQGGIKKDNQMKTQLHQHVDQRWGNSPSAAKYGHAYINGKSLKGPDRKKYGMKGFTGAVTAHDVRSGINRRIYAGGSLDGPPMRPHPNNKHMQSAVNHSRTR